MNLEEIDSLVSAGKYKQKTIDLVQNAHTNFYNEKFDKEELGAYCYEVGISIEVYDTRFQNDIKILNLLKKRLDYNYEKIELYEKYKKDIITFS